MTPNCHVQESSGRLEIRWREYSSGAITQLTIPGKLPEATELFSTDDMIFSMKEVVCRHCGESFSPTPGKPGFINECPECLFAKAAPLSPKGLAGLNDATEQRLEKEIRSLKRKLIRRASAAQVQATEELIDSVWDAIKKALASRAK